MWYHEVIGGGRCPIVDTWWQTETGAIMMTPLPGASPPSPARAVSCSSAYCPRIVDEHGDEVPDGTGGLLVIERPWPSMLRTVFGTTHATARPISAASLGGISQATVRGAIAMDTSG